MFNLHKLHLSNKVGTAQENHNGPLMTSCGFIDAVCVNDKSGNNDGKYPT